jgi:hypothetical protein
MQRTVQVRSIGFSVTIKAFYEYRYISSKTYQIIKEKGLSMKRPKRNIPKSMIDNPWSFH